MESQTLKFNAVKKAPAKIATKKQMITVLLKNIEIYNKFHASAIQFFLINISESSIDLVEINAKTGEIYSNSIILNVKCALDIIHACEWELRLSTYWCSIFTILYNGQKIPAIHITF